jgi:ribose transport system substrate-binding protein
MLRAVPILDCDSMVKRMSKKKTHFRIGNLLVLALLLSGCARSATPAASHKTHIAVIGKSMNPYWTSVEKGVTAAAAELGVDAALFVPPQENVAAQIQLMETNIAKRVDGIAIAPSNPEALEQVMRKATEAGIIVTTLDTPPVEGSVSSAYIGTDNFAAGQIAGETMAKLLPKGGKVGIVRGSDTALNALQRTEGFTSALQGGTVEALAPLNDHEDAAMALQLASSILSTHPDLAGAFGVYAYNGPAWATAISEARAAGEIKVVCFDATSDSISGIKSGAIDAVIAQREYDMGYKSVQALDLMVRKGVQPALTELGATNGKINMGVDVVTATSLRDYEAQLDARRIPHEWNTAGWKP